MITFASSIQLVARSQTLTCCKLSKYITPIGIGGASKVTSPNPHSSAKRFGTHPAVIVAAMKAAVRHEYGPSEVVSVETVPIPEPREDQVRIKVAAASLNQADVYLMSGKPYLLRLVAGLGTPKQKILGQDVAGTVDSVGSSVKGFKVGDKVFGELQLGGTFSEFTCATEEQLSHAPSKNCSLHDAATLALAGNTALQALDEKARVKDGQTVLINGASGGVGSFAIQIAKARGANVTAVCSSRNADRARQLGADEVIIYTEQDFVEGFSGYDVVLDIVGNRSLKEMRRVMSKDGAYILIGADFGDWFRPIAFMLRLAFASMAGSQTFTLLSAEPSSANLFKLKTLVEEGKVAPLVVTRIPLENVQDALREQEGKRGQGKTIIEIS